MDISHLLAIKLKKIENKGSQMGHTQKKKRERPESPKSLKNSFSRLSAWRSRLLTLITF
jgi:hypothetical protein